MLFSALNMLTSFLIIWGIGMLITYCVFGREDSKPDMTIATGIVGCGVFSEAVSIFRGVDTIIYIIAIIFSLIGYIFYFNSRNHIISRLFEKRKLKDCLKVTILIIGVIIITTFFAFNCSRSPVTYDDYLYHIQALKWINKYGVVIGQGLLHYRFGFNSAFLPLQALFDWYFTGFEYHTLNCLFSELLLLFALFSNNYGKKTDSIISDSLKFATVWIIAINMNSIVGMETDALALLIFAYVIIKIAEGIESGVNNDWREYLILGALCTFAFTVKLSVALLIIFPVFVVVLMIYEKQIREATVIAVTQIIVVLPYIIRSIIITGYVLYPVWKLDILNVDWKIPWGINHEAIRGIIVYGRRTQGLDMPIEEIYHLGIKDWFPVWFDSIGLLWRSIWFINIAAIVCIIVGVFLMFVQKKVRFNDLSSFYAIIPEVILLSSYIYWQFSAPDIRFGGFIMVYNIIYVAGVIIKRISSPICCTLYRGVTAILMVYFLSIFVNHFWSIQNDQLSMVYPKAFKRFEMEEYKITGKGKGMVTVYLPVSGDLSDSLLFPSIPYRRDAEGVELRGNSIGSGFRIKKNR